MSEYLTPAEQVLLAASQVAATEFCDFARESRAVGLIRDVLRDVEVDPGRSIYPVRVHAETMAGAGTDTKAYEGARRYLRAALVDFFEKRAAAAYMRWRNAAKDTAEG